MFLVVCISFLCWTACDRCLERRCLRALGPCARRHPARPFALKQLLHAGLAGGLSLAVVVVWPGPVPQPEASFACAFDRVSPLAALVPRITLGYELQQLYHSLRHGDTSFVVHEVALIALILFMEAAGVAHVLPWCLVMELSTVCFTLRALEWPGAPAVGQALEYAFAAAFVAIRLGLMPYWAVRFIVLGFTTDPSDWGACMTPTVFRVAMAAVVVFNGLNLYWGSMILRKAAEKCRAAKTRAS